MSLCLCVSSPPLTDKVFWVSYLMPLSNHEQYLSFSLPNKRVMMINIISNTPPHTQVLELVSFFISMGKEKWHENKLNYMIEKQKTGNTEF